MPTNHNHSVACNINRVDLCSSTLKIEQHSMQCMNNKPHCMYAARRQFSAPQHPRSAATNQRTTVMQLALSCSNMHYSSSCHAERQVYSIMLTLCHILHSVSHWPVLEYFNKCIARPGNRGISTHPSCPMQLNALDSLTSQLVCSIYSKTSEAPFYCTVAYEHSELHIQQQHSMARHTQATRKWCMCYTVQEQPKWPRVPKRVPPRRLLRPCARTHTLSHTHTDTSLDL
jgi:hypothetical protein